jgi:uncharacterized membrane protein
MSKLVVVVFSSEAQAYQGTRALDALHAQGDLTLYGRAVVARDHDGKISMKEAYDPGPLGTAVGAFTGGLIGLIGGPAGALAGVAGGAFIGSLHDLFNYGVGAEFLSKVSTELAPGKTAIVAEIAENWTIPLDTRMEALGGVVLRTLRVDFEDEQIQKEIAARRADFEQLKAEYAQAKEQAKTRLKAEMDKARAELDRADARARARLEALDKETRAKIAAVEKQLADARHDAKEAINRRAAALRSEYEKRSAKLGQAWQLTKDAFAA